MPLSRLTRKRSRRAVYSDLTLSEHWLWAAMFWNVPLPTGWLQSWHFGKAQIAVASGSACCETVQTLCRKPRSDCLVALTLIEQPSPMWARTPLPRAPRRIVSFRGEYRDEDDYVDSAGIPAPRCDVPPGMATAGTRSAVSPPRRCRHKRCAHLDSLKRLTDAEGRDFSVLTISHKAPLYDTGMSSPDGPRRPFSGYLST
jgi:hypothetical protein